MEEQDMLLQTSVGGGGRLFWVEGVFSVKIDKNWKTPCQNPTCEFYELDRVRKFLDSRARAYYANTENTFSI